MFWNHRWENRLNGVSARNINHMLSSLCNRFISVKNGKIKYFETISIVNSFEAHKKICIYSYSLLFCSALIRTWAAQVMLMYLSLLVACTSLAPFSCRQWNNKEKQQHIIQWQLKIVYALFLKQKYTPTAIIFLSSYCRCLEMGQMCSKNVFETQSGSLDEKHLKYTFL